MANKIFAMGGIKTVCMVLIRHLSLDVFITDQTTDTKTFASLMKTKSSREHSTQAHHEKHHIFLKKTVMQYALNTGIKHLSKHNAPTFQLDSYILCLLHCANSNKIIIAIGNAWLYCYSQQNCCSNWPCVVCITTAAAM